MECKIHFKNSKPSKLLKEYAETKILKVIEKFSTKPIEAAITIEQQNYEYLCHCHVLGGDGFNFQVESKSEDRYGAVDVLLHKLEAQLKRKKERLKKHLGKNQKPNFLSLAVNNNQETVFCDEVPVDAEDLLKYEEAKKKQVQG
tara:strand:+ start:801 stop:1232 length:432 start_codon:yes stop_codon:yes gene_type:complete